MNAQSAAVILFLAAVAGFACSSSSSSGGGSDGGMSSSSSGSGSSSGSSSSSGSGSSSGSSSGSGSGSSSGTSSDSGSGSDGGSGGPCMAPALPSGNVPAGGACTGDSDCAVGSGAGDTAFCALATTADGGGMCVQTHPGKAGDSPCTTTIPDSSAGGPSSSYGNSTPSMTFSCAQADGLHCGANGACTALAQTGQPCMADYDCVLTDHCDSTSNNCAAGASTGTACTSNASCTSGTCAGGCCM